MLQFVIGYACGAIHFGYLSWRIYRRLLSRIFFNQEQELISHRLQSRRDAIDYGIDQETPVGAGPAGEMSSLFEMHPGAMTLSHIAKTKSAEKVDPQ